MLGKGVLVPQVEGVGVVRQRIVLKMSKMSPIWKGIYLRIYNTEDTDCF